MIYKPKIYWTCAIGITWAALFIVGYFSHTDMSLAPMLPFMLIGLLAPFGTAVVMMYGVKNRPAARDFEQRLFNLRSIPCRY